MVALDLHPLDERLLGFAREIERMLQVKKVTGAHVIPAILVANTFKVEAGKVLRPIAPAVGKIEKEVQWLTDKWFRNEAIKYGSKIVEGAPFREIMKLIESYHVDLLVLGKKKDPIISRINTKIVARKAKCDLLIVPEDSYEVIEKILVPIDFSANSANAIKRALQISEQLKSDHTIDCVYIIDPLKKYPYLLEEAHIGENELSTVDKNRIRLFKEKFNFPKERIRYNYFEKKNHSIAESIQEFAAYKNADLIVLGAQGQNFSERLLFGSVTEAMLENYFSTPIYITR